MRLQDGTSAWASRIECGRSPMASWVALLLSGCVLAVSLGPLRGFALSYTAGLKHLGLLEAVLARAAAYLIVLSPLYLCAVMSGRFWEGRARVRGPLSQLNSAAIGLLVAVLSFVSVLFVLVITGCVEVEQPIGVPGAHTVLGVVAAAALLLFQAGAEESFFRGWLQPILVARRGLWIGVIVTAALFTAAHLFLLHSFVGISNVFLAGLLFGLLAMRTGSLTAAIVAHWVWNWLEQAVFGLTPNPGVDPLGSLIDLKVVGLAAIGAGPDELTGSVFVTLVFTIFVVILIALPSFTSSAGAARRSGCAP